MSAACFRVCNEWLTGQSFLLLQLLLLTICSAREAPLLDCNPWPSCIADGFIALHCPVWYKAGWLPSFTVITSTTRSPSSLLVWRDECLQSLSLTASLLFWLWNQRPDHWWWCNYNKVMVYRTVCPRMMMRWLLVVKFAVIWRILHSLVDSPSSTMHSKSRV